MKTNETIITSTFIIGFTSLLYSYMVMHRKIKSLDEGVNLIMSTHLLYMENRDNQTEEIKSINKTLEDIALTLPYRGVGWQTKFYEEKLKRELEHHITPPEIDELYDSYKNKKFYDDE